MQKIPTISFSMLQKKEKFPTFNFLCFCFVPVPELEHNPVKKKRKFCDKTILIKIIFKNKICCLPGLLP